MLYYLLDYLGKNPRESGTFVDTRVVYDCKVIPKEPSIKGVNTLEIEVGVAYTVPDNVWDVLGFFRLKEEDAIFLCHTKIEECATAHKWAYAVLLDIVAIHEYAHMIHYHFNPKKFNAGEVGFSDREHYVECWANWCTHHVCKLLGSHYFEIFEQLNKDQSAPYHEFKNYTAWPVEEVVALFLDKKGWINLLEKGFIERLYNWNSTTIKWIIENWKSNTSAFRVEQIWTNEVFIKIIRDHLDLDEGEQLGGDLLNLGF